MNAPVKPDPIKVIDHDFSHEVLGSNGAPNLLYLKGKFDELKVYARQLQTERNDFERQKEDAEFSLHRCNNIARGNQDPRSIEIVDVERFKIHIACGAVSELRLERDSLQACLDGAVTCVLNYSGTDCEFFLTEAEGTVNEAQLHEMVGLYVKIIPVPAPAAEVKG